MELGGGSSNNLKNKATEGTVLCYCGFPAKIAQAWTDKNPGRRFYGCERYKVYDKCESCIYSHGVPWEVFNFVFVLERR